MIGHWLFGSGFSALALWLWLFGSGSSALALRLWLFGSGTLALALQLSLNHHYSGVAIEAVTRFSH